MKYKLIQKVEGWFLLDTSTGQETSIEHLNLDELVFWVIKRILFDYAWFSDEHNIHINFLQYISQNPYNNFFAQNTLNASSGRASLLYLFYNAEQYRASVNLPTVYDGDYSDDSDDEVYDPNIFPGADLVHQISKFDILENFVFSKKADTARKKINELKKQQEQSIDLLQELQIKFLTQPTAHLFSGATQSDRESAVKSAFEDSIKRNYADHLEIFDLKQGVDVVITKKSERYSYKYINETNHEIETVSDSIPMVILFRGIGYFTDRWHAEARRSHREELSKHTLYSESILKRHFNAWQEYDKFHELDSEIRTTREIELSNEARMLTKNLIGLRNSDPIVMKQGSDYRIFANWLEFMQYVYTNGIERFLPLIKKIQAKTHELKDVFPEDGNIMVSFSELPTHAFRYARGIKKPYSEYTLPSRYNDEGKAEKPYTGKLYVTSHNISDFQRYSKPHIIREMQEHGSVTTGDIIGSELEVSFLGRVKKQNFIYSQKIRVPSFHKAEYPEHFKSKYGISKAMYKVFHEMFKKGSEKHSENIFIENLTQYLSIYHSIRLFLWQFEEAKPIKEKNTKGKVILFLDKKGGFSTKFPKWETNKEINSRKYKSKEDQKQKEKEESEFAKKIAEQEKFHATVGEIYSEQLKVFSIKKSILSQSREHQEKIDKWRKSSFGGSSPEKTINLSDLDRSFSKLSLNNGFLDDSVSSELDISDIFYEPIRLLPIIPPQTIPLENDLKAWEIDVLGDGNCLFYSLVLGYLLPYINDQQEFTIRYSRLFRNINSETLRNAMVEYNGDTEWFGSNLFSLVNGENGLRQRLADYLMNAQDQGFVDRVMQQFEGLLTRQEVYDYIRQNNVFGNMGEMMLFAALTNTNVVLYNHHQLQLIRANAEIGNSTDDIEETQVTRVLFTEVEDNIGNKVGHYHVVIAKTQLSEELNSIFEDIEPSFLDLSIHLDQSGIFENDSHILAEQEISHSESKIEEEKSNDNPSNISITLVSNNITNVRTELERALTALPEIIDQNIGNNTAYIVQTTPVAEIIVTHAFLGATSDA